MTDQYIYHANGTVMGGPWQVRYRKESSISSEVVYHTTLTALQNIENKMSHFQNTSELMQLNYAPVDKWITVSSEFITVLLAAQELYSSTNGALDVTIGDAINAWGFGPQQVSSVPSPHHQNRLDFINCGYCIDQHNQQIKKTRPVQFNLAAIAKGFAVDQAVEALKNVGLTDFLVEAAGEIRTIGTRTQNHPWVIGLELPLVNKTLVYDDIPLKDNALATSGGYRKYRNIGYQTYIHTLDPITKMPLKGSLLAVSVMHPSCMYADALATALFVMGTAKGSQFAQQHHIAARFLSREEQGICEIRSIEWMKYLET